jgi:hypothetical protein
LGSIRDALLNPSLPSLGRDEDLAVAKQPPLLKKARGVDGTRPGAGLAGNGRDCHQIGVFGSFVAMTKELGLCGQEQTKYVHQHKRISKYKTK